MPHVLRFPFSTRCVFFGLAGASLLAHLAPRSESDPKAKLDLGRVYLDKMLMAATLCAVCAFHAFCIDCAPPGPQHKFVGATTQGKLSCGMAHVVHILYFYLLPTLMCVGVTRMAGIGFTMGLLCAMKLNTLARVIYPERKTDAIQKWKRCVQYCGMLWGTGLMLAEAALLLFKVDGLTGFLAIPMAPFCYGWSSLELLLLAVIFSAMTVLEGFYTPHSLSEMTPAPPCPPNVIERKAWTR